MPFDGAPQPQTPESALILRAIDLIKSPRHWTQHRTGSGMWWFKRYCAMGAVIHVSPSLQTTDAAWLLLDRAAQRHGYPSITWMNDYPGMAHGRMLAVMHEAAGLAAVIA